MNYWLGKKFSEIHKKRLSESQKGRIAWNKGLKEPIHYRSLIEIKDCACGCGELMYIMTDHKNIRYIKGHFKSTVWKGKKFSLEHRFKLSGDRANNWQGGKSSINERLRRNTDFREWRNETYMRDDYTCQICGQKGGELNANHILKFSEFPELRYKLKNGITLCEICHKKLVNNHEKEWQSYFNFNLKTRGLLYGFTS